MANEIDVNKIVVEFVNQNIDNFVDAAKGIMNYATNTVKVRLTRTYSKYLINIFKRYSNSKSFFIRSEPSFLYQFYVPLNISIKGNQIKNPELQHIVKISQFSTIIGSAGCGKSMFMRHLLLNALFSKIKVPIFIELRQIDYNNLALNEVILENLNAYGLNLETDYLNKALAAGHFVLLLDGFDEVPVEKHKDLINEISKFISIHNKNWVVISSRPENQVLALESFANFTIEPLSLDQAYELVEKLPFDNELKDKFLIDLRKELFEKHRSFLSNPLLLSIMLLTYELSADIPTKLNVFYNQAYEALFQRHDALKGGFQRNKRCKLDIQDFSTVFSAFCLLTYDERDFQFSKIEALEYLNTTKGLVQMDFNSEGFLNDALQAVCLLIEDGLFIVFAHRSFQEYFTARFIAETRPKVQEQLIKRYSKNAITDNVMNLLHEISPDLVERFYILHKISELRELINLKKGQPVNLEHYTRYLQEAYDEFEITKEDRSILKKSKKPTVYGKHKKEENRQFSDVIGFTINKYGHHISWAGYQTNKRKLYEYWKTCEKDEKIVISTKNLKHKHPFVSVLSEAGGFFSIKTLCDALQIADILEARRAKVDESLDKIFGNTMT